MFTFRRLTTLAVAAAFTVATGTAAADDIEIYQSQTGTAQPNVLFIVDTSGSMGSTVIKVDRPPYDPKGKYDGSCSSDRIYFTTGSTPPTCNTSNYFSRANNTCKASFADLTEDGGVGMWPFGSARLAQYRGTSWTTLDKNDAGQVECLTDDGVHGETDGSTAKFIWGGTTKKNGVTTTNAKWSSTNNNRWQGLNSTYRLYSGKYLNYLASNPDPADITRMDIVKGVAKSLASSLTGVNLGLMRYGPPVDGGSEGGFVLTPVGPINNDRATIISQIDALPTENWTPLSETLYEAALYFQGEAPKFGASYSAASSMSGGKYVSPIKATCQKNYIVYLTDGAPTKDGEANADIATKTGTTLTNGACPELYKPFQDSGYVAGNGSCMDELSGYLADRDADGNSMKVDLLDSVKGQQTVQTYMIGFGDSIESSKPYLNEIAKRGGTEQAYYATDPPSLTEKLQTIFGDIQQDSGTFVTPSVAVNAFNRAQTSDDLYFSLFKVGKSAHWNGNLKKYKLLRSATDPTDPPQIVDVNSKPAVNSDGFFADGTTSYWSDVMDEGKVELGGAANEELAPDSRPLYTSTASKTIVSDDNALTSTKMSDALIVDPTMSKNAGDCGATCKATLAWLRGYNIDVNNPDTVLTTTRKYMGDPLHGKPAVVPYDDTTSVVYVPTNDGVLHAINAADGSEMWGYVPPELLLRLQTLRKTTAGTHTYGLDGDVRVLRMDKNQNGKIDTGDRVWLFFGMRAGGDHYYGIDVTNPKAPTLKWNIGPNELPNVGQTWSPPTVTRVNVKSSKQTDAEKFVLIFGGGYDNAQETQDYSADTTGNRIYMVEADTGNLLWSAGGPSTKTAPDLLLKYGTGGTGYEMNNSIPAPIRVIDTNGDGFADRMYAGDMGGRIWRFDIFNGKDPASTSDPLVKGGIFATLGAGDVSAADPAKDNRRFYNAPDVSLIQIRGTEPFFNVAIGSGYRGHPLDSQTVEKFYSLRDMNPYTPIADYSTVTPLLDGDLVSITKDPVGTKVDSTAKGWVLQMVHGDTTTANGGEKVMSESTTVNGVILFTSFQPLSLQDRGDCYPTALNRVYAITAFGGKPAINFYDSDKPDITNDDLSTVLAEKNTIVGDVAVAVLRDDKSSINPPTVCLAGMEVLKKCVNVGGTIRTFWNRGDAK
jgi:type IV pilus assembly protein PilY1